MSKLNVDEIRSADRSTDSSANMTFADDGNVSLGGTLSAGTLGSSVVVPASIGGTMVYLEKFTASNTAEKIFNLDSYTSYNKYLFSFIDIRPATDGADFQMVAGTGSSSFHTSAGDYRGAMDYAYYDGSNSGNTQDTWKDLFYKGLGVGDSSGEGLCGQLFIYNPLNPSFATSLNGTMTYVSTAHYVRGQSVGCVRMADTDDAYFRMKFSSGNISLGTITLYGIKDA